MPVVETMAARAMKRDDAADLVRMDDDGGWHSALQPAARRSAGPEKSEAFMTTGLAIVPGTREPGMLATFGAPAASGPSPSVPDVSSTMDAVTTAERQREGGGAPSRRRPPRARVPSTAVGSRLYELVLTLRGLFGWRVRTNHV
jgi:hypothetical protein